MAVSMKGKPTQTTNPKTGGMSFLKKGSEAAKALEEADQKAAAAAEAAGKMWRFRIGKDDIGKDFKITFLDGDLNDEGLLDGPMFYEHSVYHNGRWTNFVCLESLKEEPCPICEQGDSATLVQVLTVIDHTPYEIKKGEKKGQVVKDQKRLFVMKRSTIKQLQKLATKRGGLAGCTFDVTRTSDKDPNVGNMFDFGEKVPMADLKKKYGMVKVKKGGQEIEVPFASPVDYEEEIVFYTRKELLEMGIGVSGGGGISGGSGGSDDTDDEL